MNGNGMLVVVSAPSGCGKDTVYKKNADGKEDNQVNKFEELLKKYEKKEMI